MKPEKFIDKLISEEYKGAGRIKKYFVRKLAEFKLKHDNDFRKFIEQIPKDPYDEETTKEN